MKLAADAGEVPFQVAVSEGAKQMKQHATEAILREAVHGDFQGKRFKAGFYYRLECGEDRESRHSAGAGFHARTPEIETKKARAISGSGVYRVQLHVRRASTVNRYRMVFLRFTVCLR